MTLLGGPLSLLFSVAACTGCDVQQRDADGQRAAPPAAQTDVTQGSDTVESPGTASGSGIARQPMPARPATKRDTILLEGMPEPFTLRLVQSGEDFPVPFSTYVPDDIAVDTTRSEDGVSYWFYANFGGERNEDAYLEVFVYPPGTGEVEAQAQARALMRDRGSEIRPSQAPSRYTWSIAEYRFHARQSDGGLVFGTVALGRHAGRIFRTVLEYPAEFADGFGPRVHRILEEWRWQDTGEPLGSGVQGGQEQASAGGAAAHFVTSAGNIQRLTPELAESGARRGHGGQIGIASSGLAR